MTDCKAKHTEYQPSDKEWICPKCKSNNSLVADPPENADPECSLLHINDSVYCECDGCELDISGNTLSKTLKEIASRVLCPHCNGKGWIKK